MKQIDFMDIDVERMEMEVLKSIDWGYPYRMYSGRAEGNGSCRRSEK